MTLKLESINATEPFRYRCVHGVDLLRECPSCAARTLCMDDLSRFSEANLAHSPTYRDAVSRASAPRQRVGASKVGQREHRITVRDPVGVADAPHIPPPPSRAQYQDRAGPTAGVVLDGPSRPWELNLLLASRCSVFFLDVRLPACAPILIFFPPLLRGNGFALGKAHLR